MRRQSYNLFVIAAITMVFAACGKENGLEQTYQDRSLSFELSMASASHDTDESGASTKSMEIKSADGSITLPLEYRVTDGIGDISLAGESQTKGTQYNLLSELQTIGKFQVTAWNSDHSKFIPTDESAEGKIIYNSGRWTLDGTAPLWKDADVKTFFAYTNLPDGASVTCESDVSHTFSYTSLQTDAAAQKDALLGYYQGDGDRDGDGKPDGVAKIQFIHPLTAVVFVQGEFERVTAIKNLSIEGVYDGGKAVVTYSYNSDGSLVPSFDWGTSRSEKTNVTQTVPNSEALPGQDKQIGEPFILIPQDLTANEVTIKAVVTVDGSERTVQTKLSTGNWKEGMTNTYTLGYDANTYSYVFSLIGDKTSGTQTFINTTLQGSYDVTIINKKVGSTTTTPGEWLIKSVQVGSGEVEPVNAAKFENKGGISAERTSMMETSTLRITAASRTAVNPSIHSYWIGDNGNWSPADWGSGGNDQGTIDLSKMDFSKDNPTDAINAHEMTTANCYIIRHAGTYKLPLVYGNAVVNGGDNKQSYDPGVTGGDNRLERFVNSTGAEIQSPFIENAVGCGGSDLKCAVIWQDKAEVVKNLQITPETPSVSQGSYTKDNVRYLKFSISQDDICQNNALICVYKDVNSNGSYDSGEAVWSWHIWTTNDPALLSDPISVTNYTDNEYKFFPLYNLGWIDVEGYNAREDVKIVLAQKKSGKEITLTVKQEAVPGKAYGCWYQWGRKDPMPTDAKLFVMGNGPVSLSTAILNPGVFYKIVGNWCTPTYYNLWTGKKNVIGGVDQDVEMIKTIYDPSPVGYKMPASNAFTGFSTAGPNNGGQNALGEFKYGYHFYTVKKDDVTNITPTVFFPAAGYLDSTGSLGELGVRGFYWSAVANSDSTAQDLDFKNGNVHPMGPNNMQNGFSVRPVKE